MEANKAALDKLPVSMPDDPGSLGLDIPLWVGLGTVGLWAALDAFAERAGLKAQCPTCKRRCIVQAYKSKFKDTDEQILQELEDLRHLYGHNYAGKADEKYFDPKWKRHVLKPEIPVQLSCGATFDGRRLCQPKADLSSQQTGNRARLPPQYALNLSDLRKYSGIVRNVLERF
jgi:hypothetical protein